MAERSIAVRLLADVANYVQGLGRAKAATGDLITELSKSEQQRQTVQRLGTGMLVAGAGIAAGIGLATKAAIDWESSWAGVAKTVDGTDAQLAALEEELREMARTLPATHGEIAAVAEAAGQLGVATEDIADFTETMIALGETTNLTAEEAATSIAQLMNVMGTAPEDVDRLGAALVELGNNGASTEAQIIAMAQRIAGAGAVVGASEADVLALANALASAGIEVEAGGSAISKVLVSIASSAAEGGDAIEGFARVAGVSADEFADHFARDPIAALNMFVLGLGRMDAAGQNVFGTLDELGLSEIRTRDALLRLSQSGDLLTQSLEDGSRAWGENIALAEEAEKRYGTTEAKLQIARNQLTDFAIDIGSTVLPAVGELADRLGGLTEFFAGLPGPVKSVGTVLGVAAAALLLLGGTALVAIPRIAATTAALNTMAAGTGRAAVAARGLQGALAATGGFLAGPWGLALAAGAVALGIWANEHAKANARAEEVIGTLDEQTGAITDNTRAWVANELEQEGVLAAAREMGIQLDDLVDAALGNEDAVARVNDQLRAFAGTSEDVAVVLETENGQVEVSTRLLEELGIEVEEAQAKKERMEEATGKAAEAEDEFADSAEQAGDAAAGAAEDVEKLKQAFDDLFSIQMDADRAMIAYQQGLHDLMETINETSNSLRVQSQDGRENRGAILDQVEAIKELRDANIDGGMAIDDANAKYQKQLDQLVDLLVQEGFNERAIRDLIGAYRDIPDQVSTDVEQPGMPRSLDDSERLRRHYHNLPPRVETRVSAPGMAGVVDAVRQYAQLLAQIPRSVNTTVTRSGGSRPGIQERWGGITYRAQTGLLRANIFPPTAPARYAFAEPATGGEAFVPRRGDRERSLGILSEAAGWYGAQVVGGSGLGGPWQWRGQRQAATTSGSAAQDGGGMFEGSLYLDSGEFLGVVRGEIREHDRDLRRRVGARPRRRV